MHVRSPALGHKYLAAYDHCLERVCEVDPDMGGVLLVIVNTSSDKQAPGAASLH